MQADADAACSAVRRLTKNLATPVSILYGSAFAFCAGVPSINSLSQLTEPWAAFRTRRALPRLLRARRTVSRLQRTASSASTSEKGLIFILALALLPGVFVEPFLRLFRFAPGVLPNVGPQPSTTLAGSVSRRL